MEEKKGWKNSRLEWNDCYCRESEEAVAGVAIRSGTSAVALITKQLNKDDFFLPHCRDVLEAVQSLCDSGTPVDLMTVADWLKKNLKESEATPAVVAELIDTPAIADTIQYHVDRVLAFKRSRELYRTIVHWSGEVKARPEEDLLPEVVSSISDIGLRGSGSAVTLDSLREKHHEWLVSGCDNPFIKTGIDSIDSLIKIESDYLVIIGARPKTGKTSVLIDLATRIAGTGQGSGLIFSLEMAPDRLLRRINSRVCPHQEFKRRKAGECGFLTTHDLMAEYAEHAYKLPLKMMEGLTDVESICAAIRHEVASDPSIAFIGIDYIELIGTKKKANGPVETLNEVCKALVRLKKEVRRPIFLLSQLRRKGEGSGAEPTMDELKGSGMIEQSADAMFLLWNGVMSDADIKLLGEDFKKIKVSVVQRDGPDGILTLRYYPPQSLFGDWVH